VFISWASDINGVPSYLAEALSLDNSVQSILWIGRDAPTQILEDLFGVSRVDDVYPSVRGISYIAA
jgi:hypothetical protein